MFLGFLHFHFHVCFISSQGMAFTLEERLQLGIHGLIPPCFLSQDVQLLRVMRYYEKQPSDLDKSVPAVCSPAEPWAQLSVFRGPVEHPGRSHTQSHVPWGDGLPEGQGLL